MSLLVQAKYLLKLLLYWLVLFNIGRLVFMLYFSTNYSHQPVSELSSVFIHAFPLDLSTTGYIMLLPIVVSTIAVFVGDKLLRGFNAVYTTVITFLFIVVTISDLGIYNAWGTKLNARAIGFLAYPKEAAASMQPDLLIMLLLIGFGIGLTAWWIHHLFFRTRVVNDGRTKWYVVPFVFVGYLFVTVVMIRGGLQLIPINESAAYYSTNQRLNHASVNTSWYVLHSLFENRENENQNLFRFMAEEQAQQIVDSLTNTPHSNSVTDYLTTSRPNIVFIQLESFTADVVEALGGDKNVTSNLDTLIKQGLFFTNIYSPGYRTDQGLVAILNGFPAQPTSSIIKQSDKLERMPNLTKQLKQLGYGSSFYYGGELGFGNIKSFVLVNSFDTYSSVSDYHKDELSAKWGAHDEYVFHKQADELSNARQPFFSYLMTLSSHEPFDVPGPFRFSQDSDAEKFKNACAYTDRCLGDYFKRVSNEPWYNNTLFILCADHGHVLPRNRLYNEPARFHVPLLFYGPALKSEYAGKQINTLGSQVDIAATVLDILHQPDTSFRWSVSLLDSTRREFAYYSFDDGVGFVTTQGSMKYDFRNDYSSPTKELVDSATVVAQCKAYLQVLMHDYQRY